IIIATAPGGHKQQRARAGPPTLTGLRHSAIPPSPSCSPGGPRPCAKVGARPREGGRPVGPAEGGGDGSLHNPVGPGRRALGAGQRRGRGWPGVWGAAGGGAGRRPEPQAQQAAPAAQPSPKKEPVPIDPRWQRPFAEATRADPPADWPPPPDVTITDKSVGK